jgi:hypothetical protein
MGNVIFPNRRFSCKIFQVLLPGCFSIQPIIILRGLMKSHTGFMDKKRIVDILSRLGVS